MARGVNKVILLGNLGKDPEVRYTASGQAVATLTVATADSKKNKDTGQYEEFTEWHRVVLWARLAEVAAEYLKKGSKIYLEGRLQTRKWTDNNGIEKYTTEIVGREMNMLGDPNASQENQQRGGSNGHQGQYQQGRQQGQQQRPQQGRQQQRPQHQHNDPNQYTSDPGQASLPGNQGPMSDEEFSDDIPF